MTYREFLTVVAATATNTEVITFAETELAKLTEKNTKRRTTETAAQKETAAIITAFAMELPARYVATAGEVAVRLGVSTQRATALLKKGVALGLFVEGGEVKTVKGSKVKAYVRVTKTETETKVETEPAVK